MLLTGFFLGIKVGTKNIIKRSIITGWMASIKRCTRHCENEVNRDEKYANEYQKTKKDKTELSDVIKV
jgi:hypothetical protein